eukprot:3253298-Pyramimonas_sp.AAC.1
MCIRDRCATNASASVASRAGPLGRDSADTESSFRGFSAQNVSVRPRIRGTAPWNPAYEGANTDDFA